MSERKNKLDDNNNINEFVVDESRVGRSRALALTPSPKRYNEQASERARARPILYKSNRDNSTTSQWMNQEWSNIHHLTIISNEMNTVNHPIQTKCMQRQKLSILSTKWALRARHRANTKYYFMYTHLYTIYRQWDGILGNPGKEKAVE